MRRTEPIQERLKFPIVNRDTGTLDNVDLSGMPLENNKGALEDVST